MADLRPRRQTLPSRPPVDPRRRRSSPSSILAAVDQQCRLRRLPLPCPNPAQDTEFLLVGFLIRSRRRLQVEELKKMVMNVIGKASISKLESQFNPDKKLEEKGFESERPVIFSLEEVDGATTNFDDLRVIGVGGFGKVYFGMLGDQEVAIKKMKSNKSREFFAELKVLCKIHHINVVELIGYASGDGHLYLVYEYLQNGSLSDHLHDPLLRGHQPLSWTTRAQIALDAARGIEHIHDHTKSQYVHRDIKTSNILLDNGLRLKVGDYWLAKLVERSSEDDCIATRLVSLLSLNLSSPILLNAIKAFSPLKHHLGGILVEKWRCYTARGS